MTGPSSERTADADYRVIFNTLNCAHPITSQDHDDEEQAFDALDRLVARNQQLQEALDGLVDAVQEWDLDLSQWCDSPRRDAVRAALASVRARTP